MRNLLLVFVFASVAFTLAGCDTAQNSAPEVTVDEIAEYERLNNAAEAEGAADLESDASGPAAN